MKKSLPQNDKFDSAESTSILKRMKKRPLKINETHDFFAYRIWHGGCYENNIGNNMMKILTDRAQVMLGIIISEKFQTHRFLH